MDTEALLSQMKLGQDRLHVETSGTQERTTSQDTSRNSKIHQRVKAQLFGDGKDLSDYLLKFKTYISYLKIGRLLQLQLDYLANDFDPFRCNPLLDQGKFNIILANSPYQFLNRIIIFFLSRLKM